MPTIQAPSLELGSTLYVWLPAALLGHFLALWWFIQGYLACDPGRGAALKSRYDRTKAWIAACGMQSSKRSEFDAPETVPPGGGELLPDAFNAVTPASTVPVVMTGGRGRPAECGGDLRRYPGVSTSEELDMKLREQEPEDDRFAFEGDEAIIQQLGRNIPQVLAGAHGWRRKRIFIAHWARR